MGTSQHRCEIIGIHCCTMHMGHTRHSAVEIHCLREENRDFVQQSSSQLPFEEGLSEHLLSAHL